MIYTKSIFSFLLICIFSVSCLTSCSNDECTLDDYIGTYVGTKICDLGVKTDVTFSVKRNTSFPDLAPNTIHAEGIGYFLIEGCSITGYSPPPGILPLYLSEGKLCGNEIQISIKLVSSTGLCTWEGKKQ